MAKKKSPAKKSSPSSKSPVLKAPASKVKNAWECECGSIEYSLNAPAECLKCFRIDSFSQIPVEIAKDRELNSMEVLDEN